MCSLLGQWKEERFIILVSWLWEGTMYISSLPQIKILKSKKIINVAVIVNKSCISSLHQFFITCWKKTPIMFALLLLLYRTKEQRAVKYPGQVTPAAQKRPSKEVKNVTFSFCFTLSDGVRLEFFFSDKLNLQFPEFVLIFQPCWPLCYQECFILWTETQQYLFHKGEGVEVLFCDRNWHRRKTKLISPMLHIGVSF